MVRVTTALRMGLAAGPGYYDMTSGKVSLSGPGYQDAADLEGSGFGVRGMALALLKLTRSLNAELGAGYRYAKTTDVTADGTRLRNADGSPAKVDWSGFTGRAGLTFNLAGE